MHGGLVVVCVTLVELVGVNNTTQASGADAVVGFGPINTQQSTNHGQRAPQQAHTARMVLWRMCV